jgi:hypothetical protein
MIDYAARNREIVKRLAEGVTQSATAGVFGITRVRVCQINRMLTGRSLHAAYPEWPADRVRMLRALWRKGLSVSAIAMHLGTSKGAVVGKARRLDLPMRVPENARPGSHMRKAPL